MLCPVGSGSRACLSSSTMWRRSTLCWPSMLLTCWRKRAVSSYNSAVSLPSNNCPCVVIPGVRIWAEYRYAHWAIVCPVWTVLCSLTSLNCCLAIRKQTIPLKQPGSSPRFVFYLYSSAGGSLCQWLSIASPATPFSILKPSLIPRLILPNIKRGLGMRLAET